MGGSSSHGINRSSGSRRGKEGKEGKEGKVGLFEGGNSSFKDFQVSDGSG